MKVYINSTEYTIFGPLNVTLNIDDTLDTCIFYLKDTSLTFNKWDEISFTLNGETKYFSLFEYEISTENKYIEITGVEPTRILDELFIDGFAFSTLYSASSAYNLFLGKLNDRIAHTGFTLSGPSTIDFTGNSEELILDSLHTVREIMDAFLSTWDRAIRVERIIGSVIYLAIDNPNQVGSSIDIRPYFIDSAKGENITDGLVSEAKNIVLNNTVKEQWRKPTSPSILFSTDNAVIETLSPIYQIEKFIVGYPNVTWTFHVAYYNGSSWNPATVSFTKSLYFDLTSYCVEANYYKTLDYEDSFKYVYYERGKNNINHLLTINDSGVLIDEATYSLMMADYTDMPSIAEEETSVYNDLGEQLTISDFSSQLSNYVYNDYGGKFPTFGLVIESIGVSTSGTVMPSWKEALFKSEYKTMTDILISVGEKGTSVLNNQTETKLQEDKYISSLKSKKNRLGNREIELDRNGTDIYSLGDYYGNYILDKITLGIRDLNISQHYHFTKDYNALNESVKLNKELRVYEIPVEGYIKSVLELNGSDFEDYENGFSNVDGIIVITSSGYVYVPKIDNGNNITFKLADNYSVVSYLTYSDTLSIIHKYVTNYAPYVDDNGDFRTASRTIRLVTKNTDFPTGAYPFENLADYTVIDTFTIDYTKDPFEQIEIVIYKER